MSPKLKEQLTAAFVAALMTALMTFLSTLLQSLVNLDYGVADNVLSGGAGAAAYAKMALTRRG